MDARVDDKSPIWNNKGRITTSDGGQCYQQRAVLGEVMTSRVMRRPSGQSVQCLSETINQQTSNPTAS